MHTLSLADGFPDLDRGPQFESALWTQLMKLLGSKRIRTTAYHPIANDFIERLHCQLKTAPKFHTNPIHWVESLPLVLVIQTALKEDIRCTSVELVYGVWCMVYGVCMVYGSSLRLPGDFLSFNKDTTPADPAAYVRNLKSTMQELKTTPVRITHSDQCTSTRR